MLKSQCSYSMLQFSPLEKPQKKGFFTFILKWCFFFKLNRLNHVLCSFFQLSLLKLSFSNEF